MRIDTRIIATSNGGRPVGRPYKEAEEKQSIRLTLMISPSEDKELKKLARTMGMNVSQWLRYQSIYRHRVKDEQ